MTVVLSDQDPLLILCKKHFTLLVSQGRTIMYKWGKEGVYMSAMKELNTRMTAEQAETVFIASGSVHPELAKNAAEEMGVQLGSIILETHANSELYARIEDNVRGRHAVLIQPHAAVDGRSVQDAIMQHLFMIDAAVRANAASVTAAMPYLGYSRSDKKTTGREMIGVAMVVDMFKSAGVDNLMAFDLHSGTSQGLFRSFDNLPMGGELVNRAAKELEQAGYARDTWLSVAPDDGSVKVNRKWARSIGISETVFMPKERDPLSGALGVRDVLGFDPDGRACLLLDDMIDTAGTIETAAEDLKKAGASAVYVAATHNIFSGRALERLRTDAIDKIITADTHPTVAAEAALGSKYIPLRCGPLLGRAVFQNLTGGSVSALFDTDSSL